MDDSGLLTIAGGKWTTYRHMAEDCVDHAITPSSADRITLAWTVIDCLTPASSSATLA